jgi:peptidoglycan/xylan/chitin deacetylase (PgdA/CDA1 family)
VRRVLGLASLLAGAVAGCTAPPVDATGDAPSASDAIAVEAAAVPSADASADVAASASADARPSASPIPAATPDASATSGASAPPGSPGGPPSALVREPLWADYTRAPMRFTVAFDGSQRFSLWLRTLDFARDAQRRLGERLRFTYFVNACYFTTERVESDIGRAQSRAEVLVRRGLAQLAINEGHEIANHGTGHHDGSHWSVDLWREELARFHAIMDGQLFEPVADDEGGFVFPRFEPLASAAPGATGASCESNDDCTSNQCARIDATLSVCTEPCNLRRRCPEGTACGAPAFREDTDVCLPVPTHPIELDGRPLFDARGQPNPKHPRLRRYRIRGHRAPYLGANDAMVEALIERGYTYDTSLGAGPGVPFRVGPAEGGRLLEFALMPWPGAKAIPMDYNYRRVDDAAEHMRADYRAGLVQSYERGRWPWNVGHHFATWEDGAFLGVLEDTIAFASSGCPDERGAKRCAEVDLPSFAELARELGPGAQPRVVRPATSSPAGSAAAR